MTVDEQMFFDKMPQVIPLYERLKEKLQAAYPDMGIKISKTQISFRNRYIFVKVAF